MFLKRKNHNADRRTGIQAGILLLAGLCLMTAPAGAAVNLTVVGPNGEAITQYRWLAEEDATYRVVPGVIDPQPLSVRFHTSHMPVAARGTDADSSAIALDPAKWYFISVLPGAGYTIGGAAVAPGQTAVTVYCNRLPIPTAQISVFAFEDNNPIDNTPNLPQEQGLAGFNVIVEEPGGRYGISGGQVSQDAFGNPLGTTYLPGQFNPDGSPVVDVLGNGSILTGPDGKAIVKYLSPGKYGIRIVPPGGQGWMQTTTIEGTKVVDAWVRANEPPFLKEFGPVLNHVFMGFIRPFANTTVLNGDNTIKGRVVNAHMSQPPDLTIHPGVPYDHTTPIVGLNATGLNGAGLYAQKANPDGTFEIPDVPPGTYQVVLWDENLDLIIAFFTAIIPPGSSNTILDLQDLQVPNWFTRVHNYVFYDTDGDGFRDPGEPGIPEQNVNIRWRDGTVNQAAPTDSTGFVPFDEVFPFFFWQVMEVDYARFKATGLTVWVDAGGPIDELDPNSWEGLITPQDQDPLTPGLQPYRTETGPVLTQAFQGFIGSTLILEWGKAPYAPGENGGISGVVVYASTRAENDPRFAAADTWEPGIPRVQVNLYQDLDLNDQIDDLNGVPGIQLSDVDNFPFGWSEAPFTGKGPEDVERSLDGNGAGYFDMGDAIDITTSDSWDDNLPTGCLGSKLTIHPGTPYEFTPDCFEGMVAWNQARPGVFDGGYAFDGLIPGTYIVEAVTPAGYEYVKEEDKNVDFGDDYIPALEPAPCCGTRPYPVPAELTLFPGIPAPYAGATNRPLCNMKVVRLNSGANAAADFHLFTEVPASARVIGTVMDDITNNFDPNTPTFGEKFGVPWLPVSFRDYLGKEILRVYTDEFGKFNALLPSTYSANLPMPSGYAPNMIVISLNDPGPIPDPGNPGQFILDPFYNTRYRQANYTLQYMPAVTTYLDTPVIPLVAFGGGPGDHPADCEFPTGTPKIFSASVPSSGGGPFASNTGEYITIISEGNVQVTNPAYDGILGVNPRLVTRDYGFGATPGSVKINGVPLQNVTWSNGVITGQIPAGTTTGQLVVTRGDNGLPTPLGVTVTIGLEPGQQAWHVPDGGSIQSTIDLAGPHDIVLVPPGTWEEMVVMWKPVRLQGWGAGSTRINANRILPQKLIAWKAKVEGLVAGGQIDLLPNQPNQFGPVVDAIIGEEGPGIFVLAKNTAPGPYSNGFGNTPNARIDGFNITGADIGGGIVVNGYAHYLEISNNRINNNDGLYGGGIRTGHPFLIDAPGTSYVDAQNDFLYIHNNHVLLNASTLGAGAGISICTGSDQYRLLDNTICGNYATTNGAGVGHLGKSEGGLMAGNNIIFNQSFIQGLTVHGGGLAIVGGGALGGGLTPGTGSLTVRNNLIQGNNAGAGDGGGIYISGVNGEDVAAAPANPSAWYQVDVFNNFIANNVTGLAGGGIALQDALRVNLVNNTIVNNDSTATAGLAFVAGNLNLSTAQVAGLAARGNSPGLQNTVGAGPALDPFRYFSNPLLVNNILRHNRSFYYSSTLAGVKLLPDLLVDPPVYSDLGVVGGTVAPLVLSPMYCLLTDPAGYDPSNLPAAPVFFAEYENGARDFLSTGQVISAIPAPDEGGNFVDIRFGPLTLFDPATGDPFGEYHLQSVSPGIDAGYDAVVAQFAGLAHDWDNQVRWWGEGTDIGADEFLPDLNLDGLVSATDLLILKLYLVGSLQPGTAPFLAAEDYANVDLSGDGLSTAADLARMAFLLAGSVY